MAPALEFLASVDMMRAYEQGAYLASPAFIQFHPTGLPVNSEWQSKTILMSENSIVCQCTFYYFVVIVIVLTKLCVWLVWCVPDRAFWGAIVNN